MPRVEKPFSAVGSEILSIRLDISQALNTTCLVQKKLMFTLFYLRTDNCPFFLPQGFDIFKFIFF